MSAARRLLLALAGGGSGFTVPASILHGLYNGQDGDGVYAIGAITYDEGWTEYGSNPVLEKGSGGAWDDDHVKDPWLMHDGSQYVMYYAGYNGSQYQIGRATAASHEGPWTKDGSNPVVALGSGGTFDDAGCAFPTVRYDPDESPPWQMWYRSNDGTTERIAYADSSDGETWTKHGVVLDVGTGGAFDDVGVGPGGVIKVGATYYLFYAGRQDVSVPRWQVGLATFTDPVGTYTRDAGNPVLPARYNDADTSASLNATTAASAIVTVVSGEAAGLAVGEPVVIADSNTETEVKRILSIDSATQVTLTSATIGTFAAADGAILRSFAFNSVWPRTIRATPTGYDLFFTPFQPVDDLSVPGNTLWEGSMRATATDLDGPWAYDYDTGLIIPLGVPAASWDSVSAENLSLIPAP